MSGGGAMSTIRERIHLVPLATLTLVWVMLWGNLSWANVLGGMALGSLVLLAFPLPRLVTGVRVRPWPLVVLVAQFTVHLVRASVQVAWQAVTRGRSTSGVLVSVQLRCANEFLQTLTAEMVALVPGTVVIDLDTSERTLLVHALDVHDAGGAEDVRRTILAQETRVLNALAEDPSCGQEVRA